MEVIGAELLEGAAAAAAVEHARRAVAVAGAGGGRSERRHLVSLLQAVFLAGVLDGSRPIACEAVERPIAPDVPDGDVGSLGLLTLVEAE